MSSPEPPYKVKVIHTRSREQERGSEERDYYREETVAHRRPEFLGDDYNRSDRSPLVRARRERELREAIRRPSVDIFDRRPLSPERTTTRYDEPDSPWRIREPASSQNRRADEVIWDLSRTKDVTLHRKYLLTPMHYPFV